MTNLCQGCYTLLNYNKLSESLLHTEYQESPNKVTRKSVIYGKLLYSFITPLNFVPTEETPLQGYFPQGQIQFSSPVLVILWSSVHDKLKKEDSRCSDTFDSSTALGYELCQVNIDIVAARRPRGWLVFEMSVSVR